MTRRFWTEAELTVLRRLYPTMRAKEIAAHLPGWTITQILGKAWRMGLKKPLETIRQHARESMADPHHPGRATQFRTGQTTWNKGMKGLDIGGKATRFKKGQRPHTWQPIGSERINADGYLQRKVTDTGYPPRDWVGLHTLRWVEAHGPLPAGHIVIFRDGNRRNFAIDNLECISRQENMRRNTVHNLPKPVAQLVQLRGALTRKINRLSQHDHEPQHPE